MTATSDWWSLEQALAWIVTRDLGDLDGISTEDLEARAAWQRLTTRDLPDLTTGKYLLLNALEDGRLIATARERLTGPKRDVPITEFRDVELFQRDRRLVVEGCHWIGIIVRSGSVRALWPIVHPDRFTASQATTFLAFGQPRSAAWLQGRARELARRWDYKATSLPDVEAWLDQAAESGVDSLSKDSAAFLRARWAEIDSDSGVARSLGELLEMVRADLSNQRALERAGVDLVEACRAGRLSGQGHRRGDQRKSGAVPLPTAIPRTAWAAGVRLRYDDMEVSCCASMKEIVDVGHMEDALFANVTFSSDEVRALGGRQEAPNLEQKAPAPVQGERRAPTEVEFLKECEAVLGGAERSGRLPPNKRALSKAVRSRLRKKGIWAKEEIVNAMIQRPEILDRLGKKGVRNDGRLLPFIDDL